MGLVTLADVHAHLNIDTADVSHDTELQGFIDAATATVTYITGPQTATTYTETRDGGGPVIMLDNPPIISVTSVTEYFTPGGMVLTQVPLGSSTGNAFSYTLDDPIAGKITRRMSGYETAFLGGRNSVVIVYSAGTAAVAPDVRLAALEDIRGLYQQTQQGGRASLGGGAIGAGGDDQWSVGPIRLFPRLQELLSGSQRTQSIA